MQIPIASCSFLSYQFRSVEAVWFVKKTSIPNPVKSLGYIKCHSSRSLRAVKSPSNSNSVPIHDICLVLNKVDQNWVVRICRILFLKKSLLFHNLILFNKAGKNKWCFFNQKKLYYRESCKSLELYMYYKGSRYFICRCMAHQF